MSSRSKSKRTIECRDSLWVAFEALAKELGCSLDFVVADAMKQYARNRGVSIAPPPPESRREGAPARPATATPPKLADAPPSSLDDWGSAKSASTEAAGAPDTRPSAGSAEPAPPSSRPEAGVRSADSDPAASGKPPTPAGGHLEAGTAPHSDGPHGDDAAGARGDATVPIRPPPLPAKDTSAAAAAPATGATPQREVGAPAAAPPAVVPPPVPLTPPPPPSAQPVTGPAPLPGASAATPPPPPPVGTVASGRTPPPLPPSRRSAASSMPPRLPPPLPSSGGGGRSSSVPPPAPWQPDAVTIRPPPIAVGAVPTVPHAPPAGPSAPPLRRPSKAPSPPQRPSVPSPAGTVSGLGPAALPTAIASRGPQLMLEFAGNSIPINKPRFVIGRGKQGIDLTIKDPNISRQHAMVELTEGRYFLLDLGSTNGVLLGGARVARRAIEDGDEFRICGHTLRFTYQPGS